jgi:D-alanyl-D-alanine dipeptidase
VAALPAIEDAEALRFEKSTGPSGAVDVGGLLPAMARALERFRQMVTSVGGTFELKSAYRPPAYQAHLQAVWFKWMEVRRNREPGCQTLRAQVEAEFTGHHLIETQKPVTSSDHTRGLAFDATVVVPPVARLKRRRVSLDRLAGLAGIKRPDIHRDPVHFKLALARGARRA